MRGFLARNSPMSVSLCARVAGLALLLSVAGVAGAVDLQPYVASTTPADTATNVAVNTNITIDFSEPVTAANGWYDISCDTSGAHTATQSGGPTTYTLNPDTDFTAGENCTVSINGALVTDQDGHIDPMAGDYRFGFSISSDMAPTITSTTPAFNATGVAPSQNITIKFSEPVTVSPGWFAISCTSGS